MKRDLTCPKYVLLEKGGTEHDPCFKVRVEAVLFAEQSSKVHYAVGEGGSKKRAELKAAEKLCEMINLTYIPEA